MLTKTTKATVIFNKKTNEEITRFGEVVQSDEDLLRANNYNPKIFGVRQEDVVTSLSSNEVMKQYPDEVIRFLISEINELREAAGLPPRVPNDVANFISTTIGE